MRPLSFLHTAYLLQTSVNHAHTYDIRIHVCIWPSYYMSQSKATKNSECNDLFCPMYVWGMMFTQLHNTVATSDALHSSEIMNINKHTFVLYLRQKLSVINRLGEFYFLIGVSRKKIVGHFFLQCISISVS